MNGRQILIPRGTKALSFAAEYLRSAGLPVTDTPGNVVGHVLLDVPSFQADGCLRCGGTMEGLLTGIPGDTVIYGGNLNHPTLKNRTTVDFLQDERYLADNAWITAECALDVALACLTRTLRRCPVLIIGWGRIGKALGQLLKAIDADVTIAARKEKDRAMIHALGYHPEDTATIADTLGRYRLIFNTVPHPVLNSVQLDQCRGDCVKIELASRNGMEGDDIVTARGLPGIHLPESSGQLIAQTFLRLYREG